MRQRLPLRTIPEGQAEGNLRLSLGDRVSIHKVEPPTCPACAEGLLADDLTTDRLHIIRCPACHHRIGIHEDPASSADYHEQYHVPYHNAGDFLQALRATRHRQAEAILSRIRAYAPDATRVLDFGCGRGWFLESALRTGFQVAGADTSRVAIQLLAGAGIPYVLIPPNGKLPVKSLAFLPHVVTLLDVIEHFPANEVSSFLAELVSMLRRELQLLVIKVPVSGGAFYRTAVTLARIGITGPLEQLYQVGTEPPHLSYFSSRSACATVTRSGLQLVGVLADRDFEPDLLPARAHAFSRLPRVLSIATGFAAAGGVGVLGLEDSKVLFAKPSPVSGRAGAFAN